MLSGEQNRPEPTGAPSGRPGPLLKGAALSVLVALVLAGCGGGGGSPGVSTQPSANQPATTSTTGTADLIQASELSANICSAPRTGINPATGQAYPDKQGTYVDEKNWLRAWIDETYLWFDEVPTTVRASGCFECDSRAAAVASSSVSKRPGAVTMLVRPGRPIVSVPVLSKAMARSIAVRSRWLPPLNRTPPRAAPAMADRIAAGIEITTAHGDATTSAVIAR